MIRSLGPLLVMAHAAVLGACDGRGDAERGSEPAARTAPADPSLAEALLDEVVDRPLIILFEATPQEIERMRSDFSEEDFNVVADDLMYYRASAVDHLAALPHPLLRVEGRRPVRFLVGGRIRELDFAEVGSLDFIVAYEPEREPAVIATNVPEHVERYFEKSLTPGREGPT